MLSSTSSDTVKAYYSKYLLHEEYGFYHHLFEDEQLPSEFKKLEELALNIPELNASKKIREAIKKLRIPPFDKALQDLSHNQSMKLYTLVSFLTNSYLFNDDPAVDVLPESLSTVLYAITKKLGNRPIMTYSCCAFWNAQVIDKTAPVDLDNLKLRITFTGNPGEEWFYLISIANDILGMKTVGKLVMAQDELEKGNAEKASEHLLQVLPLFDNMIKTLKRMHEGLDPKWFYTEMRRYLVGYQKFPSGLKFTGVPELENEQQGPRYSGMSGGQSPFYQTFENALGLNYGDERIDQMEKEMVEGMNQVSKDMVSDAKEYFSIRAYAEKNEGSVRDAYNKIIDAYVRFKQTHWGLIARFIICPAKKESTDPKNLCGSGGTPLCALKFMGDLLATNKI